jgi:Ca-activated chloride channel family protein
MNRLPYLIIPMILNLTAKGQTANLVKGNEYYQQAQYDLAETQYRKALELDPKNTTAQYNLANSLQKQRKYDEAGAILEKLAGTTNSQDLKAASWYNQGVAYTKLQNLENSIESYKKALRTNPDDRWARENLQKALLELKKKQQQQKDQQKKQDSKMSQKEAEQKLKLLQQKEKELQQRKQNKNKQMGNKQAEDW